MCLLADLRKVRSRSKIKLRLKLLGTRLLKYFGLLAACYALARVLVPMFALNVHAFEGSWTPTAAGFSAEVPVRYRRTFCLCPAYVCKSDFEATLLAQGTALGWRAFTYFLEPAKVEAGHAENPRRIYARYQSEYCVTKSGAESLAISLEPRGPDLVLDIR